MPFDAFADGAPPGLSVREVVMPEGVAEADAVIGHCLTLHRGEPVRVNCRCNAVQYQGVAAFGLLDLAPAGSCLRWESDAPARVIQVRISPSLIERSAGARGLQKRLSLTPRFQVKDPPLAHIVLALAHALEGARAEHALVEGLTGALCSRLVSHYAAPGQAGPRQQQLSLRQRRRVINYIEANLGQRVTLASAASVAGLGVSHFKLLFKRTMGVPLHKYVVEKRVTRAVELITQSAMPMSEIAVAAGFAHQSHMAKSIRESLGVTPSMLARGHRTD